MLSLSDSESFYTLESLIEKCKKEKDARTLKILDPYIENMRTLSNELKKRENLIIYSSLKINKIKEEYDDQLKELIDEENELIETYLTAIEKEEFYLSPANLELKDLAERAREKKLKFSKLKNNYDYEKLYTNKKEQELQDRINNLPDNEHKLYLILKEYILNDKDINKIKNDLELLSLDDKNKNYNKIIRNNKPFFKETKDKMKDKKNEINDLKNEIKNKYEKKARKSMNHLNYNNMSMINTHRDDNNNNNNEILDNIDNDSFLFNNSDLNKINTSFSNNRITNLNKTFYLRTNKPFYNNKNRPKGTYASSNYFKIKNYPHFLHTDTSDKGNINNRNARRDPHYCKRLLKNYYNKYAERNNDFIYDMKMKKNQSVPKNLYQQRRMIREGLDDYVYINGNKYKQSLIGKATNTLNGIF